MREQRESEPPGFSAPPPDLPESQEIATSPELRKAELEWLKLRERVFICREVAGALAYAAGLGIIVYVACTALPNVKEAWEERNSFTAAATGERLRYLKRVLYLQGGGHRRVVHGRNAPDQGRQPLERR